VAPFVGKTKEITGEFPSNPKLMANLNEIAVLFPAKIQDNRLKSH
jgi:hypothetical protein